MTDNWKEITDPEELFKLKRDGWEIECNINSGYGWSVWNGLGWEHSSHFRARPPQPKTRKVKVLCWFDGDAMFWKKGGVKLTFPASRIPAEDKEIEVPDDN